MKVLLIDEETSDKGLLLTTFVCVSKHLGVWEGRLNFVLLKNGLTHTWDVSLGHAESRESILRWYLHRHHKIDYGKVDREGPLIVWDGEPE